MWEKGTQEEENTSINWTEEGLGLVKKSTGMLDYVLHEVKFLTFVPIAQRVHHIESDGLIGSLFEHSRCQTLICPPHT